MAAVALGLGFSTSVGAAEDKPPRKIENRVAKARSMALEGQLKRASKAVELAIERAPEQPRIVTPEAMAGLWFLRGALRLKQEAQSDEVAEAFRWALAVDPSQAWDPQLLGEGDEWRFFEALRSEVGSRSPVPLEFPERHGAVVAWLDGRRVAPDSTALPGRHLAQVECPDGAIHSAWVTVPKAPRWLKMCPGRIDLDAAPATPAPSEDADEFGDLDVFGGGAEGSTEEAPAEEAPSTGDGGGERL